MNSIFVPSTSIRASYTKALERLATPFALQNISPNEPYAWMLGREIQNQAEMLFQGEPTELLQAVVAKLLQSQAVRRELIEKLFAEGAPSFDRVATVVEMLLKAARGLLSLYQAQIAA